jgi:PTS system nitrogen regulatory IIA component
MKISDYLNPSQVLVSLWATDKLNALEELSRVLVERGQMPADKLKDVMSGLIEREELTSTGLGYGLALPHIKTNAVSRIQVVFGLSEKGIDFASLDGNPAHFFFLVLAPPEMINEYLKVISLISAVMKDDANRKHLLQSKTAEEILAILGRTK